MAVVRNLLLRAGADFSGMSKSMKKASRDVRRFKRNFKSNARNIMRISAAVGAVTIIAAKKAMDAADAQIEQEVKLESQRRNGKVF